MPCKTELISIFPKKNIIYLSVSLKEQLERLSLRNNLSKSDAKKYIDFFNNQSDYNFNKYVYNIKTDNSDIERISANIWDFVNKND